MRRLGQVFLATVGCTALIATGIGVSSSSAQQNPPTLPACAPNQQPTQALPCMPSGQQGGPPPGGQQGGPPPGGQQGGMMPGGQQGGMMPDLPACNPATPIPSPQNPCKPSGMGAEGMKPCAEGVNPTPEVPCRPGGTNPQFQQRPPEEAMKKLLTLNVEIDGSGEDAGSFDATLTKIVKGMAASKRAQFSEQMEGESFVIGTKSSTKCFADKKSDPDALADPVSCNTLSDAVDNYANTVNATVQVRMKFDTASFTPTFTATKIVIKGKSKI